MAELDIGQGVRTDLKNQQTSFSVAPEDTDGATDSKETTYTNEKWSQQLGYYKKIPELAATINAKATWTIGKGIKTDPDVQIILDRIKGWGKDTFNTILENMIRTSHIGGDAFAEIIRDEEGELINLKPLDPSSVKIVANRKGIIIRYEIISKTKTPNKRIEPENIFHLARNRVADEIHGESIINNLETIILMRNEAMADMKILMHRHVKPMRVWKVDTENKTKISGFKTMIDKATNDSENIIIPRDTVEHELIAVPNNATLNPLPWIENLGQAFNQATGVPDIVLGSSKEFTEASAKIAYLAFQQTVEEEQLFIEEQCGMQLGIIIELEFPASLENELLSDKKKDGDTSFQPNETTAGSGQ